MSGAFTEAETSETEAIKTKDVKLTEIPKNTIRFALSQNPFFYFDSLSHYFPSVGSLSNFIDSKDFLAGLEITFNGTTNRLKEISHFDYLQALNRLLQNIEADIKSNSTEYEGSDYIKEPIHKVFKDKEIREWKSNSNKIKLKKNEVLWQNGKYAYLRYALSTFYYPMLKYKTHYPNQKLRNCET